MNIDRFLPWRWDALDPDERPFKFDSFSMPWDSAIKRENKRLAYAMEHIYKRIKRHEERIDILERGLQHAESRFKYEKA